MEWIAMSYQFGDYRLDLESRKLYSNNTVVSDDGKIVQLLQALCEAYPEIVDKQILIDSLWADQIVTEGALSRVISDTRKILGDNGKDQSYIKTERNRGFRLNVQVQKLKEMRVQTTIKNIKTPRVKKKFYVTTSAVIVALIAIAISFKPKMFNTLPEFPLRVAVLPVAGELQTPVNEWVKYGVMSVASEQLGRYQSLQTLPVETIITTLTGIEQNTEKPPSSIEKFDEICGRLGCSHLVVMKYRLNQQKQPVLSYQIYSQNYRSPTSEFKHRDLMEAADMLIDSVAMALIPGESDLLSLEETLSIDAKANRDYTIGVHELLDGDFVASKDYLTLALKRMPTFFWAKAYLAKVESKRGNLTTANELIDQLKQSTLSEHQFYFLEHLRSDILYTQGKIKHSLEVSIQLLDNNYANTSPILLGNELQNIGSSYQSLGDLHLANEYLEKALEQYQLAKFGSGQGKVYYNMGNVFLSSDDKQKSLEHYLKAKEIFIKYGLNGYTLMAKHMIASTNTSLGKIQDAERELRSLIKDYKKNGNLEGELRVLSDLVEVSMKKNDHNTANALNDRLLEKLELTDFSSLKNHTLALGVMCNIKLKNLQKADTYFKRIDGEWNDKRASFILLSAYLQHAKGDLEGAVKLANTIKLNLTEDWTQTHQEILEQFEKSLLANKVLDIVY